MNFEYFIANRFNHEYNKERRMSRPAIRIATTGVALGMAVMIIALAVIIGFKKEVRNQIAGFGSHIQILPQHFTEDSQDLSISPDSVFINNLKAVKGIKSVQNIARKAGIIHTGSAFQGVLLKGVDSTYNWDFFKKNLVEGSILPDVDSSIKNGAMISSIVSKSLMLNVGDTFATYFVTNTLRTRKFIVTGIYQTTFSDYDKLFIITDISHVQRLNNWNDGQLSSLEIIVDNYNDINGIASDVFTTIANSNDGTRYRVETIESLSQQIFDWLDLLDMNAIVILILMFAVSGFCTISGLLILILERSATIGLFKALGATNGKIRKIFLAQASYIIGKGMLLGNILALLIIGIQYFSHIVKLDPTSYYVDFVPVSLPFFTWLALNIITGIMSITILVAPSYFVTKIAPAQAMRKE